MHVFSTFSTIKVKLVDEMVKVLIYVLFYMSKTKKLPFILILTLFLILGKSADFSQGSLMSKAFLSDVC